MKALMSLMAILTLFGLSHAVEFTVDANTVALWHFNEGSGDTAYDASGNNLNGVIYGAEFGTDPVYGSYLEFHHDTIIVPNNALFNFQDEFTIEALFYPDSVEPNASGATIVGREWNWQGFRLVWHCDELISTFTTGGIASRHDTMYVPRTKLNWYKVAMVYNRGTGYLYVNDTLVRSKAVIYTPNTDLDLIIGSQIPCENVCTPGSTLDFKGKIAEIRISDIAREYLPQSTGLIAHWDFNEGTGIGADDESVNSNAGIIQGSASWVQGIEGTALQFNGTDNYVNVPDDKSLDITGEITITAWINLSTLYNGKGTRQRQSIISKFNAGNGMRAYELGFNDYQGNQAIHKLYFTISPSGPTFTGGVYVCSTILDTGKWYHVAAVFKPNTATHIYLDGTKHQGSFTLGNQASGIAENDLELFIGKDYDTDGTFNGLMDEVRIYNRALDSLEILELYMSYGYFPHLISAVASDGSIASGGIDNDDEVLFSFESKVYVGLFQIDAENIDRLLPLNNGHSWLSGFGTIGNAQWSADSTKLLISLITSAGVPSVAVGDSVSLTDNGNRIAITGTFDPTTKEIYNRNADKSFELNIEPNPFSRETKISYSLPFLSDVEIVIYDFNGKIVRKMKGFDRTCNNRVIWDGRDEQGKALSSGIYIIQFKMENKICFQKLALTR
jgi:hypothetical protein